jgi:endonuclease YncB( thermonuclease family)
MEDRGIDGPQGLFSKWWPFLVLACVVLFLATGNDIFRYFSGEETPTLVENPHAYTINSPTRVKASDGDSITLSVRLVGFATAESVKQHTDCDAELELGKKAKARLQELIAGGSLELIYVRCSCPQETYGTDKCNFGRPCAILRSHGRDVGEILIAEGLAVPIRCGATSCPPQPNWCPATAKEIP